MSAPAPTPVYMNAEIPCCSPATTESVAVVRDKIGDTRSDILMGQGQIMKTQGDYTSAILRDANNNAQFVNANTNRGIDATMSQVDKYGLANLNSTSGVGENVTRTGIAGMQTSQGVNDNITRTGIASLNGFAGVNDNVTRTGMSGIQATHGESDKLGGQANTIAWNQAAIQGDGFAESRGQAERLNDAQNASADRASKYLSGTISDSFGRISAQNENGFYRTGQAVGIVDKQVVQSEMGVTRSINAGLSDSAAQAANNYSRLAEQNCRTGTLIDEVGKQVVQSEMGVSRLANAGFADVAANAASNYARLSEQNCQTKETVAAYGNRASDHTASLLATLSAQHTGITRELYTVGKEITSQAANNYGSIQLEASKNTAALQLQAALNAKESLIENSKWFALAEKTAMVNKCEIESKMAACCCEIKEAVTGTASATQALIQATDASRVRDALSVATTENAILRLRREEHHHYPPYHHHDHDRSRRGSRG